MNALMNSQKILQSHLPMDLISSWSKAFVAAHGERSGEGLNTMSETAPVPPSPKREFLHKRERLSQLLDSLAFQIKEIKDQDEWSMPESNSIQKAPDDVPLDLSVKSKTEGVDGIVTPPQETRSEPFVCGACGQSFTVQDRLAKHVASRHRNKTPPSGRAYECSICLRRFARSDMLTRHARLHTGVKPYACSVCGQLFSRSDHLATHQRTHTGEKPYHCPTCPYSACRRDMITRHLRTHTRKPQPV